MSRIQFQELRSMIDGKFLRKVSRLESAYYGKWRQGERRWFVAKRDVATRQPLVEYNIRATNPLLTRKRTRATPNDAWVNKQLPLSPKELFDKLHGQIWHRYNIKFNQINQTLSAAPNGSMADGFEPGRKGYYKDAQGNVHACKIDEREYNEKDEQGNITAYRHVVSQALIDADVASDIDTDGEEEESDQEDSDLT